MELKCVKHIDRAISKGDAETEQPEDIPDAITLIPQLQMFNTGQGMIAGVAMLPVCWECRRNELTASANGRLVTV